jgi:hypothetical protein
MDWTERFLYGGKKSLFPLDLTRAAQRRRTKQLRPWLRSKVWKTESSQGLQLDNDTAFYGSRHVRGW